MYSYNTVELNPFWINNLSTEVSTFLQSVSINAQKNIWFHLKRTARNLGTSEINLDKSGGCRKNKVNFISNIISNNK